MLRRGREILSVKDITLSIGERKILDRVSFSVYDKLRDDAVIGQIVGVIGRSGVGKTRLLRIIAGLDKPDSGCVTCDSSIPSGIGNVGMVFQSYPLVKHLTVLGNMRLAARMALGREGHDVRITELLKAFDLYDRADALPCELSGGQRQRVAIAQQLVNPKRLLALDEPFSGLDPVALDRVSRMLVSVANQHELNTIIIVTHDVRTAVKICDSLIVLGKNSNGAATVVGERSVDDRPDDELIISLEREITEALR